MPEIIFSFIVPTRNATVSLQRLLESLLENTSNLRAIEIILVVDEDDDASVRFEYQKVPIKKIIVKPGLAMGALNMAGYRHSTGQYIMLLNDDVIVRTSGWDQKVFEAFKVFNDQIVLVHANDKIFEDKLCTFPFVSRKFCEIAGGISPEKYVRYRIDDHIYNIFNLLAVLGQRRIVYLPEIIFEHLNRAKEKLNGIEYRPDERIHRLDTETFENLLESRKKIALDLMEHIDELSRQQCREMRAGHLAGITDSIALRRPEYVRTIENNTRLSSKNVRVTIGLVSANIESSHAKKCLDSIKRHTENFELIIVDNNNGNNFNHAVEMNRLISICRTEYLVLMDDDVFVEKGWLDGMLRCMGMSVGVVTPMHKDKKGKFSYAGIVMEPGFSGQHSHIYEKLQKPTSIQTVCSAVMLIDIAKCGHIKIDESYSKYFLDIDYGFRIWEAGFKVVCSAFSIVIHMGGATLEQGSQKSNELFEKQRIRFVKKWVETERYLNLVHKIWQEDPDIKKLSDFSDKADTKSQWNGNVAPRLLEEGYRNFNIIGFDHCYGILQAEGSFDINRIRTGGFCVAVMGRNIAEVKRGIDGAFENYPWLRSSKLTWLIQKFFRWNCLIQLSVDDPIVFERKKEGFVENYRGFAIFKYEHKFFVFEAPDIESVSEDVDYDLFKRDKRHFIAIVHSLTEAHLAVDRLINEKSRTHSLVRRLVFACIPDKLLKPLLQSNYNIADLTVLIDPKQGQSWQGYNVIKNFNLKPGTFEVVVVPWLYPDTWRDNSLEVSAQKLSGQVEVLHSDGMKRLYFGENLHRLIYNKAYLSSMFQVVPQPLGKKVLEIGCSDGLVCDIMSLSGASKVTGIDVMKTTGCSFFSEKIEYHVMDASQLSFEDESFDIVYSIATFEHVADPYQVLSEILRVTRVGGYAYIQAGPLYHSPFGHHMFSYFKNDPWIHLRKTGVEIIDYAKAKGIDKNIESDLNITCEEYVSTMLNKEHINGLFLKDYRLDEFMKRKDIQVLKHHTSYEGQDILTHQIISGIKGIDPKRLVEHGFELAFKRIK